jgi:hypothetical protein
MASCMNMPTNQSPEADTVVPGDREVVGDAGLNYCFERANLASVHDSYLQGSPVPVTLVAPRVVYGGLVVSKSCFYHCESTIATAWMV